MAIAAIKGYSAGGFTQNDINIMMEADENLRVFSMYRLDRGAKIVEEYRQGALLYIKR